jgi:hypothetical protein
MGVWMVLVAGEGELAVVAETPHEAARLVAEELVKASNLRVRPAEPDVAARLLKAGRRERFQVMQEICDLVPVRRRDTFREERRLREHIDMRRRSDAYVADLHAKSPPLSPEQIREIDRWLAAKIAATEPPPPAILAAGRLPSDDPKRQGW